MKSLVLVSWFCWFEKLCVIFSFVRDIYFIFMGEFFNDDYVRGIVLFCCYVVIKIIFVGCGYVGC